MVADHEPPIDTDGDGVNDGSDNCFRVFNPDQADADSDLIGDVCDDDGDNDDTADSVDNCLNLFNPGQADADGDGIGDACETKAFPTSKDECKNGGHKNFDGAYSFRNQGACVSFVATGGKKRTKG